MKIKYPLLTYSIFLFVCFCVAFLYLSSLGDTQTVSEFIAVTGPMPLAYLLVNMGWVPLYFIVVLVSIVVSAVLWILTVNTAGIPRCIVGLGIPIVWVLSGLFSLGISYYG